MNPQQKRKEARREWPIRVYRLEDEPPSLSATTTPEERLMMMWTIARDAWSLSGRTLPTYSRSEIPIRIVPLGDS